MKYINQIKLWLHATWIAPLVGILLGIIVNLTMGITVNAIMIAWWLVFGVVCVIWWFWVMGAIRHIIGTFDRVESQLSMVSGQLTDIKRELGSIREHNY